MNLSEYRKSMWKFAVYPNSGSNPLYAELGLLSEIGELAGEAKRVIRDDEGEITPARKDNMISELGDIMWYLSAISHERDSEDFLLSLDNIEDSSLEKFPAVKDFLTCINKLPSIFYSDKDQNQEFYIKLKSLISYLETSLEVILQNNIDKLQSRMDRNKIKGSGGDR